MAAIQMAQAYREGMLSEFVPPETFHDAQKRQHSLNRTSMIYA